MRRSPARRRASAGVSWRKLTPRSSPIDGPRLLRVDFLNGLQPQFDLTYDDVFMVPRRSDVASRHGVDLRTSDGTGTTIPLVVANMTAIAGRRMAETTARRGGITVIPQDIPTDVVAEVIAFVKDRHLVHDTPITLERHVTVGEALALIAKRAHGAGIVVARQRPRGGVTGRGHGGVDRFSQVHEVMPPEPMPLPADTGPRDAYDRLHRSRRRVAPVVDADGRLVGVQTRKGAVRASMYAPALDGDGRLRIAAAVGINGDVAGKASALLEAGVDARVVDTAHGHQTKMLAALAAVRALDPQVPVVA